MDVQVRQATTNVEFCEVYRLTYRVYAASGYCNPSPGRKLQHYPHLDEIPATTVLIAIDKSLVIGTVSITLDGPVGLHVDEDFAKEMKQIRWQCGKAKRKLSGIWRIVTDPLCRSQWIVVKRLIGAITQVALDQDVGLIMCDFHPAHEKFYRRVVGFHRVAYGTCNSVAGQPAVLMAYDLDRLGMPIRWRK